MLGEEGESTEESALYFVYFRFSIDFIKNFFQKVKYTNKKLSILFLLSTGDFH